MKRKRTHGDTWQKDTIFSTRCRRFPTTDGKTGQFYSLPQLEKAGVGPISKLPVSIRIVLESVLRNVDGKRITENDVRTLANWQPNAERTEEIPFVVARIVLQDFTGVPLLVDLAAMRSAVARLGKDPGIIEPLVPVDLVVDHSVQVDFSEVTDALQRNMEMEFKRNRARYQFLKWGMQAFNGFGVVPPGIGIVHQVNLEYLAKGVLAKDGVYYPDTLVGTDSHTTMINGLGIVGWGVGGIEAEAGMLGQPVYFLTPDVVGVHLTGALKPGVTATDLVLTHHRDAAQGQSRRQVRRVPRRRRGLAVADGPGDHRATWPPNTARPWASSRSMRRPAGTSPPRAAPRSRSMRSASISRRRACSGCRKRARSSTASCWNWTWRPSQPSVAGPKRPQDRINLTDVKDEVRGTAAQASAESGYNKTLAEVEQAVRRPHRRQRWASRCDSR